MEKEQYEIVEVISNAQKTQFFAVVDRVYAQDPQFIYPLKGDVEAVFDPAKNKSFLTGAARRWVVMDDKRKPVARIAAFYTQKPKSGKRGGIGFFECINNRETMSLTKCANVAKIRRYLLKNRDNWSSSISQFQRVLKFLMQYRNILKNRHRFGKQNKPRPK